MLSRRSFLFSGVAVVAAPLMPALPAPAAAAPKILSGVATFVPAKVWICGTPGEMDWQAFAGETAQDAWSEFCRVTGLEGEEAEFSLSMVERAPEFDGKDPRGLTNVDWLRAGYHTFCERCDCEIISGSDGKIAGGEAVCEACLTFAERVELQPDRIVEELANDIAEAGEEEVRTVLVEHGNWNAVPPALWARALAEAAAC